MSFPLFKYLYDDTKEKHEIAFPIENQEFIISHINDLDENGREIFFAIIRQYQLKYESNNNNEIPNYCKQLKSGIRIDFNRLSNPVKYMLHEFMEKHLKKLNEDTVFFKSQE